MRPTRLMSSSVLALTLSAALVAGCGSKGNTTGAAGASGAGGEAPVAVEKNPPGDIPDNQAFVTYRSSQGGYQLEAPEGWARSDAGGDVTFIDKLNGEQVTLSQAAAAPTAATARANEVAALEKSGRAVQVLNVKDMKLPGGSAVFVEYTANSAPDAVTGKQVRLENQAYLFFKDGKLATVTLWAPKGADNVDQWQRIAQSFRWL